MALPPLGAVCPAAPSRGGARRDAGNSPRRLHPRDNMHVLNHARLTRAGSRLGAPPGEEGDSRVARCRPLCSPPWSDAVGGVNQGEGVFERHWRSDIRVTLWPGEELDSESRMGESMWPGTRTRGGATSAMTGEGGVLQMSPPNRGGHRVRSRDIRSSRRGKTDNGSWTLGGNYEKASSAPRKAPRQRLSLAPRKAPRKDYLYAIKLF